MRQARKIARGFSLVSAIFLLVVVAAIGTFAMTLSTTQHHGSALDVSGARAYQAARAGVEWGVFQVLQNANATYATTCQTQATSETISPLAGTLADFNVVVQCTATANNEGERNAASNNPIWVYRLTSTASRGVFASPDYVERQITVTIWR